MLQCSNAPNEHTFSPETLKKVVKNVVQEEDRSRNFMIFGLPEDAEEQFVSKVCGVLEVIGQKSKIEAFKMGSKMNNKGTRPFKVTLSSSTTVDQILANVRNLRNTVN